MAPASAPMAKEPAYHKGLSRLGRPPSSRMRSMLHARWSSSSRAACASASLMRSLRAVSACPWYSAWAQISPTWFTRISAAAWARALASRSLSGFCSAGDGRAALATPATARSARSNSAMSLSMLPSLAKKRAPEGARWVAACRLFLEAVRHADERPIYVRAKDRRVALPELVGRHARPGELSISLVIDLRPFHTEARALGEAMLVTDAPHLGAGIAHGDRTIHVFRLGIERLDRAESDGNGNRAGPLLRRDVTVARAQRWQESRAVGATAHKAALVLVALVGETDVDNAEVEAAHNRPARVVLADGGEVLVPVIRGANPRAPAHARPLQRTGPHRRLSSEACAVGQSNRLQFGYLVHQVERDATERWRGVTDHVRRTPPERMAHATAAHNRIALRSACGRHGAAAGRNQVRRARSAADQSRGKPGCRVRGYAGGLTTADDRRHRTEHAYLTDCPQRVEVRPRRSPLAHEHVAETALDAGRGVARRHHDRLGSFALERRVLLDLEPGRQSGADAFSSANAEVGRRCLYVEFRYRRYSDRRRIAARREAIVVLHPAERRIQRSVHFHARLRERQAGRGQRTGDCHR